VVLSESQVADLMARLQASPGAEVSVDLVQQTVTGVDGFTATFEVDAFRKHCLLNGLDDIGLTLQHEPDITAFEARRD